MLFNIWLWLYIYNIINSMYIFISWIIIDLLLLLFTYLLIYLYVYEYINRKLLKPHPHFVNATPSCHFMIHPFYPPSMSLIPNPHFMSPICCLSFDVFYLPSSIPCPSCVISCSISLMCHLMFHVPRVLSHVPCPSCVSRVPCPSYVVSCSMSPTLVPCPQLLFHVPNSLSSIPSSLFPVLHSSFPAPILEVKTQYGLWYWSLFL